MRSASVPGMGPRRDTEGIRGGAIGGGGGSRAGRVDDGTGIRGGGGAGRIRAGGASTAVGAPAPIPRSTPASRPPPGSLTRSRSIASIPRSIAFRNNSERRGTSMPRCCIDRINAVSRALVPGARRIAICSLVWGSLGRPMGRHDRRGPQRSSTAADGRARTTRGTRSRSVGQAVPGPARRGGVRGSRETGAACLDAARLRGLGARLAGQCPGAQHGEASS